MSFCAKKPSRKSYSYHQINVVGRERGTSLLLWPTCNSWWHRQPINVIQASTLFILEHDGCVEASAETSAAIDSTRYLQVTTRTVHAEGMRMVMSETKRVTREAGENIMVNEKW